MNPLKLKLKNFTVFKDEEIVFDNDGVYVVYGKEKYTHKRNAIGKTSVVEAIRFALYGDTKYKDKDRPISFGEKKMEVEFTFKINDDEITVKRLRTRGKSSEAQLLKNGESVEIARVTEITEEIINLTGIDYNVFQECFYINKIDLADLTATKLINFLKSVLKLNRFDKYRDKAKDCLQKAEIKLSKVMGIKETLEQLQSINKNKKQLLCELEFNQSEYKKCESALKDAEGNLEEAQNTRSEAKQKMSQIQTELNKIDRALERIKTAGICPMCKTKLKDDKLEKQLTKDSKELGIKSDESDKIFKLASDTEQQAKDVYNTIDKAFDSIKEEINKTEYHLQLLNESGELNQEETEKEYKRLLDLKAKVEDVVNLFSPTNFPLYILNQYLPNLELIVNGILGEVSDFSIEIITSKETKSGKSKRTCELVIYKNGREYNVHNLSGGEETIIHMAFKIGVSKMFLANTNFNLLVIDEGFGKLGEVNQKIITEMITRLKDTFKKILVITHVDSIRDYLENENKIELLKDNGVTKIIDEN